MGSRIRTFVVVASFSSVASAAEGELVVRALGETEAPYGHLEYVPPGYAADDRHHALLVALHGVGEIGDGQSDVLGMMTRNGPGRLIADGSTWFADHEMLVFVPQSTEWWDSADLHALFGYIAANFRVDPRRVYLTGLSMGGGGTWDYVASHPGRMSAALPICGAESPGDGTPFVGTAVWAFHAWGDDTVPRANSIGWVDAIADATAMQDVAAVLDGYPHTGGDTNLPAEGDMTARFDGTAFAWQPGVPADGDATLRLTLYPDAAHDAWTRTYEDAPVLDWFASQRKPPAIEGDDDIVIDNLDAGATFTGAWARSEAVPGFWWWDDHEASVAPDLEATFTTPLEPAIYEVYVSWSAGPDRAVVDATIAGALEEPSAIALDMTQGGGFTSIGEFTFDAGQGAVTLRPAAGASGIVVADAVGFVHRGAIPGSETSGAADDSGSSAGDDGAATTDPASDDGPADTSSSGGESSGAAMQDETSDGCGCTQGGGAGWAGLLVLATMRRRRRR